RNGVVLGRLSAGPRPALGTVRLTAARERRAARRTPARARDRRRSGRAPRRGRGLCGPASRCRRERHDRPLRRHHARLHDAQPAQQHTRHARRDRPGNLDPARRLARRLIRHSTASRPGSGRDAVSAINVPVVTVTPTTDLQARCELLRSLHRRGDPLVLPNAWDVATAKAVVEAGFEVVATTSWAVAAALGYEDGERAPADEMLAAAARIARSVEVPVTVDAEAGYGMQPA